MSYVFSGAFPILPGKSDRIRNSFEVADPTKVRTRFTVSPHDRWWVGYFPDVHGLDLTVIPGAPPPTIFTWTAD